MDKLIFEIEAPKSIPDMLRLKMAIMRLNQKQAAEIMGISNSCLSQIMNGKLAPNVEVMIGMYKKFNVDGNWLLEHL